MGVLGNTITFAGRRFSGPAVRSGLTLSLLGLVSVAEGLRLASDPDANRLHQTLVPGSYVTALGGIVLVSGLVHIWRNAAALSAERRPPDPAGRHVFALLLCLAGYTLLIERIGYEIASLPFFLAVLRVFAVRSWTRAIVLSVVFTVVFYLLFVRYLGVILPRGVLGGIV